MENNTLNNDYILYSLNVEDAQNIANDTIDRDLTDSEIRKVEARIGDYFSNWFDLLKITINDVVNE